MAPQLTIDKIQLRGFSTIRNATTVELGKHLNLIDSATNDVKLSVLLAIDFVLNPIYRQPHLAMNCLHPSLAAQNDQAYVTLHISSNRLFELNKKKSKAFEVTRYLREDDLFNVYYSYDNGRRKRQPIETFHIELIRLRFTVIHSPIISQRVRPTSSELNDMVVKVLQSTMSMDLIKDKFGIVDNETKSWIYMMNMHCDNQRKARQSLTELRCLELKITSKDLDSLNQQYPDIDIDCSAKCRDFLFFSRMTELETNQTNRLESLKNALHKADNTDIQCVDIDLTEFRDLYEDLHEKLDTFSKDMVKNDWTIKENNKLALMQANIRKHGVLFTAYENYYRNSLEAAKSNLEALKKNDAQQKIKSLVQRVWKAMDVNAHDIDKAVPLIRNFFLKYSQHTTERFDQRLKHLKCTNELALAELSIGYFAKQQTVIDPAYIDTWQKGISAMTPKSTDSMDVPNGFVGNLLEFINPNADHIILDDLFPALFNYFPLFMFESSEQAKTFETSVKPLLNNNEHIFVCHIGELDPANMDELPYTGLSEYLLTNTTSSQLPFVKNWFDQFRVSRGNFPRNDLRMQAIQHRCQIINQNVCYRENGFYSETFYKESAATIKDFLLDWTELMNERDIEIKSQADKFDMEEMLDGVLEPKIGKVEEDLMTSKTILSVCIFQIGNGIKRLFELAHTLKEAAEMESAEQFQVSVIEKMITWHQMLDPEATVSGIRYHAPTQIPWRQVHDSIKQFETVCHTIVHNLANDILPISEVALVNHLKLVGEMLNSLPEPVNFKQKFNLLLAPPKPTDLNETYTRMGVLEEEKLLLTKINKISREGDFLDSNRLAQLNPINIDLLNKMKESELAQCDSANMILPDLDSTELDYFLMDIDFSAEALQDLKDDHPIRILDDEHSSGIYFNVLIKILHLINDLDDGEREETIGLQLTTLNDTISIFPHTTIDAALCGRFPMKKLCDNITGLTFIGLSNNNNNEIFKSDLLDVKTNRYSVLFHLALSVKINPSLIILSNTILGIPTDELRKIIKWFMSYTQLDELVNERSARCRQVILVDRSADNYRQMFENGFQESNIVNINN